MQSEQVRFLAKYNEWMNERIYSVCAEIPDAERKAERGAFFNSIHGTLNHMLLADRIWLGRFDGAPHPATRLDEVLYSDFDELRSERTHEDERISRWAHTLDDAVLSSPLTYTGIVEASPRTCTLWIAVTHLFNHQTHHRGQLTCLLSQMNVDYGATDMIGMPGLVTAIDER